MCAVLRNWATGDDEDAREFGASYDVAREHCPYCGGPSHRDEDEWCDDYHAYQRSIDPAYNDAGEED